MTPHRWWFENPKRRQKALSRIPEIRATAKLRAESVKELFHKQLMHIQDELEALKLEVEKIKENSIPEELKKVWEERERKVKLPI